MFNIIFVTGNKGKVHTFNNVIEHSGLSDIYSIEQKPTPPNCFEIQTFDVGEISMNKAKQAWAHYKEPLIVQDSAIDIVALDGFPGALAQPIIDKLDPYKIIKLMYGIKDRTVIFRTALTYIDENGQAEQFLGYTDLGYVITDYVAEKPHPKQWSEWWRIISPQGLGYYKTLAELSNEELMELQKMRQNIKAEDEEFMSLVEVLKKKDRIITHKRPANKIINYPKL